MHSKTLKVGLAGVIVYLIFWAMTALFGTKQERARAILLEVQPAIMERATFGKTPDWHIMARSWCPFVVNVSYFISWGPLAGVGRQYSVVWFFGFRKVVAASGLVA